MNKIIEMRMQQFDKDVLHWKDYDFVVINEDLDKCYKEIIGYLENKLNTINLKLKTTLINCYRTIHFRIL